MLVTTIQAKSIMRGNTDVVVCKPGNPAPSIGRLLVARIETCVTEAGLTSSQLTTTTVPLLLQAFPEPVAPDPLTRLTRPQLAIKAVYNLLWPATDTAINGDLTKSKGQIADIVEQQLSDEGRTAEADRVTIINLCSTAMTPYIVSGQLQTKRFLSSVPVATAANPLAPLPLQGIVSNAIRQLILTTISTYCDMALEDFKLHVTATVITELTNEARSSEADETDVRIDVDTTFDPSIAQAELALYTSTTALSQELRTLIQQAATRNPNFRDLLVVAAEYYLSQERRSKLHNCSVLEQNALVEALERMEIVKAMYAGSLQELTGVLDVHLKSLNVLPAAQQQAHFQENMVAFGQRVTQGLIYYSVLVEQGRRPPEQNVAQIEVCPDEVQKRLIGSNFVTAFRSNSARVQNKVRLSVTDSTPTVVHELGHQVEFYLPIVEWVNIQQILHDRCTKNTLIDIYENGQEAAFAAIMSGFAAIWTGNNTKYGSKIYADGDTEVMSMSVECFSTPANARLLIRYDPLLAATILRAIRPLDVAKNLSSDLLKLLPHG